MYGFIYKGTIANIFTLHYTSCARTCQLLQAEYYALSFPKLKLFAQGHHCRTEENP